eukprot:m.17653 g.17653  ORF g.17653 m.17653 type:complete len:103 (-) comp9647_c0_seq1:97-405(-)
MRRRPERPRATLEELVKGEVYNARVKGVLRNGVLVVLAGQRMLLRETDLAQGEDLQDFTLNTNVDVVYHGTAGPDRHLVSRAMLEHKKKRESTNRASGPDPA